ncbi:hAT family dimerization protein [Ceratobasidium sp. AG-Ba]|nr:hAT family dimerization protein [Ceratobasidium sp. AG-Ba]
MAQLAPNIDINVALSVAQTTTPAPIARKKRRKTARGTKISRLSDLQAWKLDDAQIHAADRASCKSDVYNHFNAELVRHTRPFSTDNGAIDVPNYMEYVFTCKTHPEEHNIRRRQEDVSRGIGNFHSSIATCHRRYPLTEITSTSTTGRLGAAYSYTMHLAIILIACAYHYLPFARVLDKLL